MYSYYHWDETTGGWVAYSKDEFSYDATGNTTLHLSFDWDETTSQWIANRTETHYYSEHNVTLIPEAKENEIYVYPNPAKEFIVFSVTNISESKIAEIFDNQGRKVIEQDVSENSQINVSKLDKGLYLFRLNQDGKIFTGKIVVE
jgi:hypothetical protein